MRVNLGILFTLTQCLLAFSPAWAIDECEKAGQQLRSCSEERRKISKKHSICEVNLQDLQGSIRRLEADLQDQSAQCQTSALKDRAECNLETQKLNTKLQAVEQELDESKGQVSGLADQLQDASSRENWWREEQSKCDSVAIREALCQKNAAELQKKLTASEAAREDSDSQATAASVLREEARMLSVRLEQERENCQAISSQHKVECDAEMQDVQQKLKAAEADLMSVTGVVESLSVEVRSCQAALGEEAEARKHTIAQAALQESLQAKISNELKQKEELLAEHDRGKKKEIQELRVKLLHVSNAAEQEIDELKSELSKIWDQFRSAEQAYLPLWTHPYYDEAAKHASTAKDQAFLYYDQEIATGKAYQKSKQAVLEASKRFKMITEPHISKARVAIKPMYLAVMQKLRPMWHSVESQLQKDQYMKIVKAVSNMQDVMHGAWTEAKIFVASAYHSDLVNQARDDLAQMYSLLLGANVSGSGIDAAVPAMMAQYTLVGIPLLFLFPVMFMCCTKSKPDKSPPKPVKSKAQLATSKASETKRSKRR